MPFHTMHFNLPRTRLLLLSAALSLGALPAMADKPAHAGGPQQGHQNDKHDRKDKGGERHGERRVDRQPDRQPERRVERPVERRDGGYRAPSGADRTNINVNVQIGGYFTDAQRRGAVEYYEPRFRAGNCPPGLAKKRNGCMPPGQAKQWHRGAPLPRDVVYYPVPDAVVLRLGAPPAGHRYVRVATDILLIAVGTSMVIDAIEDLGRL